MIVGLKRVFVLLYLLPFEVRVTESMWAGIGTNRLPLASVVVTTGSTQSQGGGDKTLVSLHCRINLSPFTKDFRGGELLRVNCIFGHLLTAELQWNVKSKENLTVYQQAVEGCAAGHFLYLQPLLSLCQAFIFI